MRAAAFSGSGVLMLAPVTLCLDYLGRAEFTAATSLGAGIAARLAAGIMKCTSGDVFIADFDPKIQPVQVKRLVGFLPSDRPRNPFCAEDYFSYRAALWGLNPQAALTKGHALLSMLDGLERDEAALLAGIFLHDPQLIILERPGEGLREAAQSLAVSSALFITYGPTDRVSRRIPPG